MCGGGCVSIKMAFWEQEYSFCRSESFAGCRILVSFAGLVSARVFVPGGQ